MIDLYYITSGIAFYIALQFIFFIHQNDQKKLYFYFALLTIIIAVYQYFTAKYYEANSLADAIYAMRIQIDAIIGYMLLFYFFISEYTEVKQNKFFSITLVATALILLIENTLFPYSLRFDSITSSSTFYLPSGEKITNYFGPMNPLAIIGRILYVGLLIWSMWRTYLHYSKNRIESLLLGLFIFFMIISFFIGYAIDTHKIDFVYIPGFVYFFLVISMTTSLGFRLFAQKKELESTALQLKKEIFKRKEIEDALIFNSKHDELTALPNRVSLLEHLEELINQTNHPKDKIALLLLDLDDFKELNDSLGHELGDKILQKISKKIMQQLKDTYLTRLGGDEFCLVISSLKSEDDTSSMAHELLKLFELPIQIEQHEIYISGSIGISIFPEHGTTPIELLRNADSAMYKAKNHKSHYEYYTQDMTQNAIERVSLETHLRHALKHKEFVVYYQPQVNGYDETLIGMEALVRWNHPELGLISPEKFIPLAEITGLIVSLDQWVMKTAMKQVVQWYTLGLNPGILAINLSVKQLRQPNFISFLKDLVSELNFQTQWLELEITETQIMENAEEANIILNQISELGIQLAIDDFGTGYSSLSYLKRFPLDKLKIDKSFVDGLPNNNDDINIAKSIIALAQNMKLNVIAEGVETKEQKDFLIQNGCVNIQGYFYGKPVSAEEFEKSFLR